MVDDIGLPAGGGLANKMLTATGWDTDIATLTKEDSGYVSVKLHPPCVKDLGAR